MPRKTVTIEKLRTWVNYANANSNQTSHQRQGHNDLLEQALHDSGQYHGYRYIDGHDPWRQSESRDGPADETLRYYFGGST